MARPKFLTDVEVVKKAIDEYKLMDKPTLSGLITKLGLKTLHSLYSYMDEDSEIGDLLTDAYIYLVDKHETKLYDKVCVGSIFYLKSMKRLGYSFRDSDPIQQTVKDSNITITIVPDATTTE